MKQISIFNLPKSLRIDKKMFLKNLLLVLKTQFKIKPISIIFVDEKEIQELNNEYRQVNLPTDVLSFNYDRAELLGEVYVSFDYIKRTSSDENEIYRVIIHGILHLLGFDHKHGFVDMSDKNVENMFIVQESILANLLKELQ
jgi:probable rRNA maturation factor